MSRSGKNNSLTHSLVHSALFTNHLANVWTGGAVCAQRANYYNGHTDKVICVEVTKNGLYIYSNTPSLFTNLSAKNS